jgi:hypothetical protein
MARVETADIRDDAIAATILADFDAIIYGHPEVSEDRVAMLRESGIEVWRYFNVFHSSLQAPEWGGYHGDLFARLERIDGWIPGVRYRWFPSALGPSPIIDHTRYGVTRVVDLTIARWAAAIDADYIFLDVTFDHLHDWMLWPGDRWPWPGSEHARQSERWRSHMKELIASQAARRPVAINGSYELQASVVMFESQPWNHRRGLFSWRQLVERITSDDIVPIVHAGHLHLHTDDEIEAGERMTLAVWLLADQSYLAVEPEDRQLAWIADVVERGLDRFRPLGPAVEVEPNLWVRRGLVDGVTFEVRANVATAEGWVEPVDGDRVPAAP